MSKREIRYLVILAIMGILIAGGALFVADMQRSSTRAANETQSTIDAQNAELDATARATQP